MSAKAMGFVCSFESLGEIPARRLNEATVLEALREVGRVSVFELTERPKLASIVGVLERTKRIKLITIGFPWYKVEVA
jgi:hypothetical protein